MAELTLKGREGISYIVSLILLVLLSALYAYGLTVKFYVFESTILFHVALVAIFYILYSVFCCVLLGNQSNLKVKHAVLSLILGFFWWSTALLYIVDFVSLSEWGQMVSYPVVQSVLLDLQFYVDSVGLSLHWLALLMLIYTLVVGGLAYWFVSRYLSFYFDLSVSIKDRYGDRVIYYMNILIVVSILSVFFMVTENEIIKHELNINGDVFYSFLKPQASIDFSFNTLEGPGRSEIMTEALSELTDDDFVRKNIILITVDALRADRTSVYGYEHNTTPFLDSLYQEGSLGKVDLALSNCATSFCGILSILSGQRIFDLSFANFKIHDVFKSKGYETVFLLGGAHNDWYYLKRAYEFYYPIDYYFEGPMSRKYGPSDDEGVLETFEDMELDRLKPHFVYIHLMSTHRTGKVHEAFEKYLPVDGFNYLSPDSILYSNNYDNGVLQSDYYIKRAFAQLDRNGLLDNSLVIITADHGEAIGENERFGHAGDVYNYNTRIPFLVYDTDSTFVEVNGFLTQKDISSYILEAVGIDIPSFWSSSISEDFKIEYQRQNRFIGAVLYDHGRIFKFMTTINFDDEKLYDINKDPNEKVNIVEEYRDGDSSIYHILRDSLHAKYDVYTKH